MATFYNSATLSYNGNVTSSNVTTGELIEVISATKTAIIDRYTANDTVTYVISIINTDSDDMTGLTVTDNLGSYNVGESVRVPLTYTENSIHYYSNGVLQAAPAVTAGARLEIRGITVPANGNVTLIYEASVNGFAPLGVGSTINNIVTVDGENLATPVTATETITADSAPALTISKSLSPTTVTENDRITYTFTIQNYGNTSAVADDNVILEDTFDPILSSLEVVFNSTVWSTPANYAYDIATGKFITGTGQITVPAATYTQDPATGLWSVTPGVSTLIITGTV